MQVHSRYWQMRMPQQLVCRVVSRDGLGFEQHAGCDHTVGSVGRTEFYFVDRIRRDLSPQVVSGLGVKECEDAYGVDVVAVCTWVLRDREAVKIIISSEVEKRVAVTEKTDAGGDQVAFFHGERADGICAAVKCRLPVDHFGNSGNRLIDVIEAEPQPVASSLE